MSEEHIADGLLNSLFMLVSKSVNGCCAGYEANYDKLHDTRPDTEDPDKHKENKTTVDV
jgi:hypothetical protein